MKKNHVVLPVLILCLLFLSVTSEAASLVSYGGDGPTKCEFAYQRCLMTMMMLVPNPTYDVFCMAGYIWCLIFLE